MELGRSSKMALMGVSEKERTEIAISTGPSLELCTYPETLGCAIATDALEQLFVVEKMLQDDYFKCNEETKAFLKDVAVAVKKLEQMRKETIDHLEMESMELSKMYFLLRTVPGKFYVELEECVKDARKLNIFERKTLQKKILHLDNEAKFLRKKLREHQEVNETLGVTQESLASKHQAIVMELNYLLEEKAKMTISINEIYVQINSTKELLDLQKQCYKMIIDELENERNSIFERRKALADKIQEIKKLHDQKKIEAFNLKKNFQALTHKMLKIKDKDTACTVTLSDQNLTIVHLQEAIKQWQQEINNLKTFCNDLDEKTNYFIDSKSKLDNEKNTEKEDLLLKIKELAEKLQRRRLVNKDLQERFQNLSKQLRTAIRDENKIKRHQKKMQLENEKLLTYITEKENFLLKRKVDIRNLAEGITMLKELLQATKELYRKEIKELCDSLHREYQRRKGEHWVSEQNILLRKLIRDIQNVQETRNSLEIEISDREKEMIEFMVDINELSIQLKEDKEYFVDKENMLIEKLSKSQSLFIMEKHSVKRYKSMLQESLPNFQVAEVEFSGKTRKYDELYAVLSAQQEKYCLLRSYISQSAKDFTRFSVNTEIMKQELNLLRNQEDSITRNHFERLKNLENEIYVNDLKTDAVLQENENLRQYIDYMKCLIEQCRNKKEQLTEIREEQSRQLEDHKVSYSKLWNEYLLTVQELTKEGDELLGEIKSLKDKVASRDEKIKTVSKLLEESLNALHAVMQQEVKEKPLEKKKKKQTKKAQVPEPLDECRKRLIEKKIKHNLKVATMNSECMNTTMEKEQEGFEGISTELSVNRKPTI